MSRHKGDPPPEEEAAPGPNLGAARVSVLVAWAASVVGVVLAVLRGDLLVGLYALLTAITTAGWTIAIAQWERWRTLALWTVATANRRQAGEDLEADQEPEEPR